MRSAAVLVLIVAGALSSGQQQQPQEFQQSLELLLGSEALQNLQSDLVSPGLQSSEDFTGDCNEGQSYIITNYDDLVNLKDELGCIFAAGLIPKRPPLGFAYGRLVSYANSLVYNRFINTFFQGDFFYETRCENERVTLGEVKFRGSSVAVGDIRVGRYKDADLIPAEESFRKNRQADEPDGLVYSFDTNLFEHCGPEKQRAGFTAYPLWFFHTYDGFLTHTYPSRIFTDVLRVVGRQDDGGLILLGRTFVTDPASETVTPTTAYYFTLTTYDTDIYPDLQVGAALPPLKESFTVNYPGLMSRVTQVNPLEYLMGIMLRVQSPKIGELRSAIADQYRFNLTRLLTLP